MTLTEGQPLSSTGGATGKGPLTSFHFSIERKPFLKALTRQQSLIEKRPSLPILSHVLLHARDGALMIKGTDMEMSLLEDIPAFVHRAGSASIPAHMLYDIVKNFPELQKIDCCIADGEQLFISSGSIEFKIPVLSAQDFPHVAEEQDFPFSMAIKASVLRKMIDDTRFSMSNEEARYSLNGIYFHNQDQRWYAVSTDAQRLSLSYADMDPALSAQAPGVIIGRKAVQEISKILDDSLGNISLSLAPSRMMLSFDGGLFTSRLLEGQFPDYWQAIPQDHPKEVVIDAKALQGAVRRVGMVCNEKHTSIKVDFSKGRITLSAQSQTGSAVEALDVQYDGESVCIGMNPKHLIDVCQHISGDKVSVRLKDTQSPVIFFDSGNPNATFVIMPMHIVS